MTDCQATMTIKMSILNGRKCFFSDVSQASNFMKINQYSIPEHNVLLNPSVCLLNILLQITSVNSTMYVVVVVILVVVVVVFIGPTY